MGKAHKNQNFLDSLTQQWVILTGRKLDEEKDKWLLGPFGDTSGIGSKFTHQLTEIENLRIEQGKGLIQSVLQLNLPEKELKNLSEEVVDFYENTSDYDLDFKVSWNPFFKIFGKLLKVFFSNRIEQLNIPVENTKESEVLKSEIIQLYDEKTREIKHTLWLRSFKTTGQIVYSGVYEICKTPSGQTCIKAVFPLPNGNATVILSPYVGQNGDLILKSLGEKFGDSGFYFLLKDSKDQIWSRYLKSFRDKLVAGSINDKIFVEQTLTLWRLKVLKFEYIIQKPHS